MNFRALIAGAALAAAATVSLAADYPSRPVSMIVPFPPGGSTDMVARVLAQKLHEKLGGTFVVENKAGATGTIGAAYVKNAQPDGYTLLVSSLAPFAVNPFLQRSLPYDPAKDFEPLSVLVQAPNVLVANPSVKANTVAEVIAYLKQKPGEVTFASSGAGSSDHLTAELFWQETGTKGLHIPYKGGAPAIQDLMGGQVQFSFQNLNAVITQIQAGKLKAIAITSTKRSPLLPNVPTLAEAGIRNVDVYSWQAIAGPKGLPPDVKKKLMEGVVAGMNEPDARKKLTDLGFEIVTNTPEQFAKFQAQELARWKKVIETAHIEPS
ncbi:MAG TPA: tripartite tricarboxylate transporter substrate binding protein [Usitatibacter sp.]|nr:tripartite tricarboxylate transporter substrate binding protein [Usitatibacter sp.]